MTDKNTCQYIGTELGYTRLQPTCTGLALAGRSYCLEHHALIYKAGSATRRKKDQRRAEAVWDLHSAFNEAIAELEAEGFDCWGDSERTEA